MMILFDAILEGYQVNNEQEALDYARGICSDWETTEQPMPTYHRHIDTVNGIEVYYDFGADYYFFVELQS
jgi:hypothetical protein